MDSFNSYLNNVNRAIGDNMRFVRDFQANQQTGPTQTDNNNMQAMMSELQPLILMMLFQLLNQQMNGGLVGTDPSQTGNPFPPVGAPSMNNQAPLQNPAYQLINNLLTQNQARNLDFKDSLQVQAQLDKLLDTSANPEVFRLSDDWKTMRPDTTEAVEQHDKLRALLQQEGWNEAKLYEFDLLWQVLQLNSRIDSLNIVAVGNPSPSITEQITAAQKERDALATQWQASQGNTPVTPASVTAGIQSALRQGSITEAQLGSSLKYLLDKGPTEAQGTLKPVLISLMRAGQLSIHPFLQSEYLEKLPAERRGALMDTVEEVGLYLESGMPNSRFIGFILESLGKPGASATKTFIQQVLQRFYDTHSQQADTPTGALLANVLALASVQANQNQQLVFQLSAASP